MNPGDRGEQVIQTGEEVDCGRESMWASEAIVRTRTLNQKEMGEPLQNVK